MLLAPLTMCIVAPILSKAYSETIAYGVDNKLTVTTSLYLIPISANPFAAVSISDNICRYVILLPEYINATLSGLRIATSLNL